MIDTQTVTDTELNAMMEGDLECNMCHGPAQLMSRGHRCRPPGHRTFKCVSCHAAWATALEFSFITGEPCRHAACGAIVNSVSELAEYHPV